MLEHTFIHSLTDKCTFCWICTFPTISGVCLPTVAYRGSSFILDMMVFLYSSPSDKTSTWKPHVCIFCLWMVSHIYNCFAYFETDCPLGDLVLSDSYINFLAYWVTKPCLTRDVWQTTVPQQKAHTLRHCWWRMSWLELIECCFVISSCKR